MVGGDGEEICDVALERRASDFAGRVLTARDTTFHGDKKGSATPITDRTSDSCL